MSIAVGDKAPDFDLPTDGGGHVKLSDLQGQPVVIYFYPKDMTPGCTTESCDFRDQHPNFAAVNAKIIGISKDSAARHDKFKEKHDLNFTLASDEESDVCERYGVWKEKSMYGKKFMGIERTTVIVDAEGVIRHIWPKVKVKGHVDEVLAAVQAL
ncbi:alkyl hydroperoxide reductase [Thalassospira profundimaris]|uniref:thioredoxin-dependent peroxiredoxin n=1 Tax=Thalassospira profundimaris TaxID=502049 RepID=A0A367XJE8_9PROT|nr:thioredoxin-dependent thiol peroxidase [Thalassospira profundimaris]RCK53774.1 alkyl hydroperoxide reductase [Thalassospira profundimaris]